MKEAHIYDHLGVKGEGKSPLLDGTMVGEQNHIKTEIQRREGNKNLEISDVTCESPACLTDHRHLRGLETSEGTRLSRHH